MVPLLLLDVDGVLNAVDYPHPDFSVWPDYCVVDADALEHTWTIWYSPTVVRTLLEWHESGRVEIQWLTTWEDMANGIGFKPELPELEVAGWRNEPVEGYGWWKLAVVKRLRAEQPHRQIIWIDDDLSYDTEANEWLDSATEAEDVWPVRPRTTTGLTPEHLEHIEARLKYWEQAA